MASQRGGSSDALDSLLSDTTLGRGIGEVFARPKSLADMKKRVGTPVVATSQAPLSPLGPSGAQPAASASPQNPPPARPQPTVGAGAAADPFSLDHLGAFLPKSTSNTLLRGSAAAAAPAQDAGAAGGQAAAPADPFASGSSELGQSSDDTFGDDSFGLPPAQAAGGDPFDVFGGRAPADSVAAAGAASGRAHPISAGADLMQGFSSGSSWGGSAALSAAAAAEPPQRAAAAAAAAQPAAGSTRPGSGDFGDFMQSSRSQPSSRQASFAAAANPFLQEPMEPEVMGVAPRPPALRTAAAAGRAASASPPAAAEKPRSRYRIFDQLDAAEAAGAAAAGQGRPSRPPGFILDAPHEGPGDRPLEAVAVMGQKAAKAVTAGTKWFMKAGRSLVKEVTAKLDKHRPDGAGGSGAGPQRPGSGGGDIPPYLYDWASGLARMSPGSRAAALGALGEEDRLAVQRVLDEASLGESYMESEAYAGYAEPHGSGGSPAAQAVQPSPPLPPQYDELYRPQQQQEQQQEAAAPPLGALAAAVPEEDLLGMSGGAAAPARRQPPAPAAAASGDLLGFDDDAAGPGGSRRAAATQSTAHIDRLFTVLPPASSRPAAPPAAAAAARPPVQAAAAAQPRPTRAAPALDSMIDLGGGGGRAAVSAEHQSLYEKEEDAGEAGEPEIRRVLRARRLAEKHERMAAQLAERRARDEAEEAEVSGKVQFRAALKPKVDAWAAGKKDNIRALLSSLHTVLWEGSGWVAPSMSDMVDNARVKRHYMRANLVVHPDKVKQKGGTLEQITTADMVFDVLKGAWGKFEAAYK